MTMTTPATNTHAVAMAPVRPPTREAGDEVATGLAAIAAATTVADVYRAACALAARLPCAAGVAILRQNDRGLLGIAYNMPAAPVSSEVLARAAISLHQRWIASHARGAPEHGPSPFIEREQPNLLVVPFVQRDAVLGALVLAGEQGHAPVASQTERVTATAIGMSVAQALDTIAARQRLELSIPRSEHEAELAAARKQLGRNLHDGPAQDLALAGMALDRIVTALGEDQAPAADARQARDLIDRAILEMRSAIGRLRTTTAPAPSITGPLRELLAEMAPDSPDLEIDFREVSGVNLAPEVERALVGIVREALHNVRKHADAESVRLEVRRGEGAVEVAVVDDGVGFEGAPPTGHFGLEQIRELAEETGGQIRIDSSSGEGTAIRAWIPLPAKQTTGRLGQRTLTGASKR